MLKFKHLVHRGGVDRFAALMADGSLMETAPHPVNRKPQWHKLDTGEMAKPIASLTAHGERLVAVDRNGIAWEQHTSGMLAARGNYEWHRLDWPLAEDQQP